MTATLHSGAIISLGATAYGHPDAAWLVERMRSMTIDGAEDLSELPTALLPSTKDLAEELPRLAKELLDG